MIRKTAVAAATVLMVSSPAFAGVVLGSTASFSISGFNWAVSNQSKVVQDPGEEVRAAGGNMINGVSVIQAFSDLNANTLRVGFRGLSAGSIGYVGLNSLFTFTVSGIQLDAGEQISGLSLLLNERKLNALANINGNYSYAFTGDSITIALQGYLVQNPDVAPDVDAISFNILTSATEPAATVPEPSTLGLLGAASAGLLLAGRRRRSA